MDTCKHCGDQIIGKPFLLDDKKFCCNGCKTVYSILVDNNLGQFYDFEANPGTKPVDSHIQKYAFLDIEEIRSKYVLFEEDFRVQVKLFLPSIHCSSCIYLLENIKKINDAIISCEVNFTQREANIHFDSRKMKLSELADLLHKIGYAPNFGDRQKKNENNSKVYFYKLGIAGFAFGSIMLWSFPEYLGIQDDYQGVRKFTSILSFLVSIPVLFYSAREYLISAYKAVKYKSINLDVPITIGILALYLQSTYTIFVKGEPGYMDSFAAFVFFLLIGKWFQNKTYRSLSFDRDYTSYFPVAVSKMEHGEEVIVQIEKLKIGDQFIARNEEVVPCDAILESDSVKIDYSFVSGESRLVSKVKGDLIYAGGRVLGTQTLFQVKKETNRSQLTQMWNSNASHAEELKKTDRFSINFMLAVFVVMIGASIYWFFTDTSRVLEIAVAILIVACPCAIALSKPFTYGNIMRLLGRQGLYLKNTEVIPHLASITDIIFDKTGTLTTNESKITYHGKELSKTEWQWVFSATNSSNHPYSRQIATYLKNNFGTELLELESFEEIRGKGIEARINTNNIRVGSNGFVSEKASFDIGVGISINDQFFGYFSFESEVRQNIERTLKELTNYKLHLLSGDDERDQELFVSLFPENSHISFHQTPQSKMEYVDSLEKAGKLVLMIGDGLNDVGALKRATVGISVTENIFQFTPTSDAIISADALGKLSPLLKINKFSKRILSICLVFSVIYNSIGLGFAVSGQLSPIVAAILMPISSITIVFIATFGTMFFAPKGK